MSGITKINTGAVISDANQILSAAKDFKTVFDAMYDAVHALRDTWTSTDGNSYIAKIDSYQDDFTSMYNKLVATADGLRQTAEDYAATVKKNTIS